MHYFVYLILLPIVNFILLQLFAFFFYLLYFFSLGTVLFFLHKKSLFLSPKKLFFFSLYWLFLYITYSLNDEKFYDFYIDNNFTFQFSYMQNKILVFLLSLHLFILFLLGYNASK